jgi:hypothetical protein
MEKETEKPPINTLLIHRDKGFPECYRDNYLMITSEDTHLFSGLEYYSAICYGFKHYQKDNGELLKNTFDINRQTKCGYLASSKFLIAPK